MIDIRGRVIVIAGASSGIGRATAIECAREGMHVVVGARRKSKLDETVEACTSQGVRALAVEMDVTSQADCDRLVQETLDEFGSLHAIYANAGYGLEAPMEEMSDEDLRAIFETNFWGSMQVIRPALAHMRGVGSGHVLMCSSCLSKLGVPYYGAYCATKACQDHIARAMRLELRGTGIHVSSVHPVRTRTEFFEGTRERAGGSSMLDRGTGLGSQPASTVARATVRCLKKPRGEVWTSTSTRLALALATAFPELTDRLIGMKVARMRESIASKS